jgi:hypothetical protein
VKRLPMFCAAMVTVAALALNSVAVANDPSPVGGTQPVQKPKPPAKNPCNAPNPPHSCKRPRPPH